jgi:4-amino-4-deoxy-L-arabinose transferase-like glycosyltransferase
LATTSFLAAIAIIRAVRTSTWRWLLIFSLLISIGFNTKMLVAFVPLPAFFLYYVLAVRYSGRTIMLRCVVTATVVFILSGLWISIVALTPSTQRPYIGSIPDNSIFTLVFEYNGLDRFRSFIGPRFRGQQQMSGNITSSGQSMNSVAVRDQLSTPMPARNSLADVWGLFTGALAEQLGWLLLVVLLLVPLAVFYFYPRGPGVHPFDILRTVRGSPQMSELVLWTAWLGIGCVVFGLARSTTTHPYYLVGIAIPLSASLGIGVSAIMHIFARGTKFSWIILGGLIVGLIYQVVLARNLVSDWVPVPVFFLGLHPLLFLPLDYGHIFKRRLCLD